MRTAGMRTWVLTRILSGCAGRWCLVPYRGMKPCVCQEQRLAILRPGCRTRGNMSKQAEQHDQLQSDAFQTSFSVRASF